MVYRADIRGLVATCHCFVEERPKFCFSKASIRDFLFDPTRPGPAAGMPS